MKRSFSYITVGQILDQLQEQGVKISRITFYKLEGNLFPATKVTAGKWRVYDKVTADTIIKVIKENYGVK